MKYGIYKKLIVYSLSVIFLASSILCAESWGISDNPHGNMKNIEPQFKEGELLVKFKPGVDESKKKYIHDTMGSKEIKEFHKLRIDHVNLKKGTTVEEAVAGYEADPDIEYAEPNYIRNHHGFSE